MELTFNMIKLFWNIAKIFLSNPILIILLILYILLKIFYPKIRGYMGEFWVKLELNKLSKKEYIILNDIMLEDQNGTHQIDHIVISKYGIFVIETKNYYGMIVGDEYQVNWTQYLGKNKYSFKNPIHQNYGHIKVLQEILKLGNNVFIPIVCFSNQAKIKVKSKSIVIQLNHLIEIIKKFYKVELAIDIKLIANKIETLNIKDKEKRRKHINNIKEKLKEDNIKINNMICPKCGNELVLRNGKYGTFIGCSNYPNCTYTKK